MDPQLLEENDVTQLDVRATQALDQSPPAAAEVEQQQALPLKIPPFLPHDLHRFIGIAAIIDVIVSVFVAFAFVSRIPDNRDRTYEFSVVFTSLVFFLLSLVLFVGACTKSIRLCWIWLIGDSACYFFALTFYFIFFWGTDLTEGIDSNGTYSLNLKGNDRRPSAFQKTISPLLLFLVTMYKIYESACVYYYMYGEQPQIPQQQQQPIANAEGTGNFVLQGNPANVGAQVQVIYF